VQIHASKAKWGNSGDCRISSTRSYGILALGYVARRDVSALIIERAVSFETDCLAHNFRVPCPRWQRGGRITCINI